jgi:hypothetical protein
MYAHLADLASLIFNLVILTLVMSTVGWGVIKTLRLLSQSRAKKGTARAALVADLKARADERRRARLSETIHFS